MQELIRELTWLLTDNLKDNLLVIVTPRILMEVTQEISGRVGGVEAGAVLRIFDWVGQF